MVPKRSKFVENVQKMLTPNHIDCFKFLLLLGGCFGVGGEVILTGERGTPNVFPPYVRKAPWRPDANAVWRKTTLGNRIVTQSCNTMRNITIRLVSMKIMILNGAMKP